MQPFKLILPFFTCIFFITNSNAQIVAPADSVTMDNTIFSKVDEEASFPDGKEGWKKFLIKNLNFSTPADNGAPIGKFSVLVKFIVSAEGKVSSISPLTHAGYGTEEELIRLVKKSGLWKPATINGKPVTAITKQAATFINEEDGIAIKTAKTYTLFTGIDNEISMIIRKVKLNDIRATISEGTITAAGNGKFIVRVPNTSFVTIDIFDKTTKLVAARFDVNPQEKAPKL